MLRISALNDDSSSDSEQSDSEIRTKEAQEDEAFQLYNSALRFQRNSQLEDAENTYREILDLEFLIHAPAKGNDFLVHPGTRLKYSCLKNLGDISLAQEKLDDTLDFYLKALQLDSRDVGLWFKLGTIAEKVADFYLAKQAYQEGLGCSPRHWLCLDKIISMTHVIGDYVSCLLYVSRALSVAPEYPKGHIIRNEIFKEQPSLKEDIKLFGTPTCDLFVEHEIQPEELEKYKNEFQRMKSQMPRPQEPQPLPVLKFNKSLRSYTWQSLGHCLNSLYDKIDRSKGKTSFASPVDATELLERGLHSKDEAKSSRQNSTEDREEKAKNGVSGTEDTSMDDEADTEDCQTNKKHHRKRKGGLWQELLELEKRRSTRMRSSCVRRSFDFSYAETLLKLLPASLQQTEVPSASEEASNATQSSKEKNEEGKEENNKHEETTKQDEAKNQDIIEIDIADSDDEEIKEETTEGKCTQTKDETEKKENKKEEAKMEVDGEKSIDKFSDKSSSRDGEKSSLRRFRKFPKEKESRREDVEKDNSKEEGGKEKSGEDKDGKDKKEQKEGNDKVNERDVKEEKQECEGTSEKEESKRDVKKEEKSGKRKDVNGEADPVKEENHSETPDEREGIKKEVEDEKMDVDAVPPKENSLSQEVKSEDSVTNTHLKTQSNSSEDPSAKETAKKDSNTDLKTESNTSNQVEPPRKDSNVDEKLESGPTDSSDKREHTKTSLYSPKEEAAGELSFSSRNATQESKMDEHEKASDNPKDTLENVAEEEVDEETAVKRFLSKHGDKHGLLEILYGFVLEVATTPVLRGHAMSFTYCEAYYKARWHYPLPCVLTSHVDDPDFYPDAIAALVNAEISFEFHNQKQRENKYISHPETRRYQEELSHLEFAFSSEDSEKFLTKGTNPHPYRSRLFWLEAQVALLLGNTDDAFCWNDHLRSLMKRFEEKTGKSVVLNMKYIEKESFFAMSDVENQLQFLGRNQKLGDVLTLYEEEEYECVVELISSTFGASQITLPQGNSEVPERHVQLKLLMGALTQLGDFTRLVHLSCVCLEEALCQFDSPTDDGSMRTTWGETVTHILLVLENSMQGREEPFGEVDRHDIGQLAHQLIRVITVGLEIADCTSEILIETITPWILLHRIFLHEESLTDTIHLLDEGIPASLGLLNTGHEWLGKKSWCCNANGTFLLYIMDTLLKTLKEAPTQLAYATEIQLALEQCFFCLYTYPSKKTKARHLADHNVHQIRLTWERAYQLYMYFRPIHLPEYDSYTIKGLNTDGELLFQRILELIPLDVGDDGDRKQAVAQRLDQVKQYIEGDSDEYPNFPEDLSDHNVLCDIYYLLADHYLKATEWAKAIKYYQLDICINSHRVDSWAGLSLARMGAIEKKLNLCFVARGDDAMYKRSKLALRCFQRTMDLDPDTPKMWIEYGALAYMMHSFASRQFKTEIDSMSLEQFEVIEKEKEELLDVALDCFTKARNINIKQEGILDEQWLLNFMTGKVYEKKGKPPAEYLELYDKARQCLHDNGAEYPRSINYQAPSFGAVEALEVFYRMHACILKALIHAEGQPLDPDARELYLQYLKNLNESPLVQLQTVTQEEDGNEQEKNEEKEKQETEKDDKKEEPTKEESKDKPKEDSDDDVVIIEDDDEEEKKNEEPKEEKVEEEDKNKDAGQVHGKSVDEGPPSPLDIVAYDDGDDLLSMAMDIEIKEVMERLLSQVEEKVIEDSKLQEESKERESSKSLEAVEAEEESESSSAKQASTNKDDGENSPSKRSAEDSRSREKPKKSEYDETMESLMKINQELERINREIPEKRKAESGGEPEPKKRGSVIVENKPKEEEEKKMPPKRTTLIEVESKQENVFDHYELVSPCLKAMALCIDRFEHHYKALYRLAHYYATSKYHKNVKWSRDLLLGTRGQRQEYQQHMPSNGLFSGRSPSNLFGEIWRFPNHEVDRPGSFAAHMYRCVNLLIEVSAQQDEHMMLFSVAVWLSTKPDQEKMYLYEGKRTALSDLAYSEGMRVLGKKTDAVFAAVKSASSTLPTSRPLYALIDVYKVYKKMNKDLPSKASKAKELLEDTYKKFKRGKVVAGKGKSSLIEQAKCFCEQQMASIEKKRNAFQAAKSGRGRGRPPKSGNSSPAPAAEPTKPATTQTPTTTTASSTITTTTAATDNTTTTTATASTTITTTKTTDSAAFLLGGSIKSNKPRTPIANERKSFVEKIAKETGFEADFLIGLLETPGSEEENSPNPPKPGQRMSSLAPKSTMGRSATPPVPRSATPPISSKTPTTTSSPTKSEVTITKTPTAAAPRKSSLLSFRRSSTTSRTTNSSVQSTASKNNTTTITPSSARPTATPKSSGNKSSVVMQRQPPNLQRSFSTPSNRPKPSLTAQARMIVPEKEKTPEFLKKFGSEVSIIPASKPSTSMSKTSQSQQQISGNASSSVSKLRNIRLMKGSSHKVPTKRPAGPSRSSPTPPKRPTGPSRSSPTPPRRLTGPNPSKRQPGPSRTSSMSTPTPPRRINLGKDIIIKQITATKTHDANARISEISKNRALTVTSSTIQVTKKPAPNIHIQNILSRMKGTISVTPKPARNSSQDEIITLD